MQQSMKVAKTKPCGTRSPRGERAGVQRKTNMYIVASNRAWQPPRSRTRRSRRTTPRAPPRRAKVLVPPGGHEHAAHREAEDREVEGRGEAEAEAVHEEAGDDPGDDRSEAVAVERGGGEHGPQERGVEAPGV